MLPMDKHLALDFVGKFSSNVPLLLKFLSFVEVLESLAGLVEFKKGTSCKFCELGSSGAYSSPARGDFVGGDNVRLPPSVIVGDRGVSNVNIFSSAEFPPFPSSSLAGLNISLSPSPIKDDSLSCLSPTVVGSPLSPVDDDASAVMSPPPQCCIPNPIFALVDSSSSDILPFPPLNMSSVTVHKYKKLAKKGMWGIKDVMLEQSFINPGFSLLSLRGLSNIFGPSISPRALRYCVARLEFIR